MIWHIVRKDLSLLWPVVLTVAAVHMLAALLGVYVGRFSEPQSLAKYIPMLSLLSFLGVVVLTVVVFHQDPVPGDRQDWLARPIRRRDLACAKLLFVILFAAAPLLAADLLAAMLDGFPVAAALSSASWRSAAVLCLFGMPALALGAVTRNVTEALMVGIAAAALCVGVAVVSDLLNARSSIGGSGLMWMIFAGWCLLPLLSAPILAWFQYTYRRTATARAVIAAGVVMATAMLFLPWSTGFALQTTLSGEPQAGRNIILSFAPDYGRFHYDAGAAAETAEGVSAVGPVTLYLPLRAEAVPADGLLIADAAVVSIDSLDGRPLYRGRSNISIDGPGSFRDAQLEIEPPPSKQGASFVHQRLFLPRKVYASLASMRVRLAVDYSLTLFRVFQTHHVTAVAGSERSGDFGWCGTKVDRDGDGVVLACLNGGSLPTCFRAYLVLPDTPLKNPDLHSCAPDYGLTRVHLTSAVPTFDLEFPFLDPTGLAHFPIDGAHIKNAQVAFLNYTPRNHFVRRLVIPDFNVSEWVAASATN